MGFFVAILCMVILVVIVIFVAIIMNYLHLFFYKKCGKYDQYNIANIDLESLEKEQLIKIIECYQSVIGVTIGESKNIVRYAVDDEYNKFDACMSAKTILSYINHLGCEVRDIAEKKEE